MNDYIKNKLSAEKLSALPEPLRNELIREAEALSALGVSSDQDYKDAFYILLHAKKIAEELSGKKMNASELSKISSVLMDHRAAFPLNSIHNFYRAVAHAMNKTSVPIKKIAYPSDGGGEYFTPAFNRHKWMAAMRSIYDHMRTMGKSEAFNTVTKQWDKMEKEHFKNWMSFYEENAHKKYKTAQQQNYLEVGNGAYLPLQPNELKARLPVPNMDEYNDDSADRAQKTQQLEQANKEQAQRDIIALIGRLNSAERIATKTDAVREVLGPEGFKVWLNALHTIKREIQTAPIKHVRSATAQDLIIKNANILFRDGHDLPGKLMMILSKLAQVAPPPLVSPGGAEDPAATGEPPVEEPIGEPGEPAMGEEVDSESEDADAAMEEFLQGLSGSAQDTSDISDVNDISDELFVTEDELVATAQVAPPAPLESEPKPEEITENVRSSPLDAALQNVTVEDIIQELESLAQIYGNRELARRLNLVDAGLGELGLASYFPSLAEAMRSALDSNQYVLTRLEDIISKLRSSSTTEEAASHLRELERTPENPNMAGIKNNLQESAEREKARKERRKAEQEAEAAQPAAPPGTPAPAPAPAPAPVAAPSAPSPNELAGPAKVEQPNRI
jgi:hypothetical protein